MCDACGGALLDEEAQGAVFGSALGVDPSALVPGERPCPSGIGQLGLVPVGALVLEYSPQARALWFDAGKLTALHEIIRQHANAPPYAPAHPLHDLQSRCSDCGERRVRRAQMLDVGAGMLCEHCLQRAPSPTGQPFSYLGATVTVTHSGDPAADPARYRAEVTAQAPFDLPTQGALRTPSLWQRLLRLFGKRGVSMQRPSLDDSLWMQSPLPEDLQALFGIHGVPELTLELLSISQRCELNLSARRFSLSVEGWLPSATDARFPPQARVESIARRLYDRVLFFHKQRGGPLNLTAEDQWSPVPRDTPRAT
jgi:Zn-finger nucleic acid-binding protein